MTNIKRILITGGAGFIGAHTVDLLLQQNKEVLVLDNLFSGKLNRLHLEHPNIEFIEGDVLELPLLVELMETCDAVLHLAAIASVPYSISEPVYSMQVNTQGLVHVLEAARQIIRPIRIVFASSAAVYGDTKKLPAEDTIIINEPALSPYSLQKLQGEQYAELYARLYNIPSLALRYFNVYGAGQDPQSGYAGVISKFLLGYQQNQTVPIFGDGSQSRDFISVHDVAQANLLALESDIAGVVNIATGKDHTLLQLAQYIERAGKKPLTIDFAPERAGDIKASFGTTEKAIKLLNFKAKITLEAGIRAMVEAMLSNEAT